MEVKNNVGEEKKHSRSFCFMICNETVTRSLNTMDANSAVFCFFFFFLIHSLLPRWRKIYIELDTILAQSQRNLASALTPVLTSFMNLGKIPSLAELWFPQL